jgi:hypothetical protein
MTFDPRTTWCHHTGMTKTCHQARQRHDCPKWIGVEMTDPTNPEARIQEHMCADRLVPLQNMAINNNLQQRLIAVQQAIESRGDAQEQQAARAAQAIERIAARGPYDEDAMPKLLTTG